MNFIAKHLLTGVAFVVGIILLIVGLFSDGNGLAWLGSLLAIGGVSLMAYNMYRTITGGGVVGALSEMTFGSKESHKRRSSRKLDSNDSFGAFGDD